MSNENKNTMNATIDFLKTLPENSGQKVKMNTMNGVCQFYFMWFYDDNYIDLKPCGQMSIVKVHKKDWGKITLIME